VLLVLLKRLIKCNVSIHFSRFVILLESFLYFFNANLFSLSVKYSFFFHSIHGIEDYSFEKFCKILTIIFSESFKLIF